MRHEMMAANDKMRTMLNRWDWFRAENSRDKISLEIKKDGNKKKTFNKKKKRIDSTYFGIFVYVTCQSHAMSS